MKVFVVFITLMTTLVVMTINGIVGYHIMMAAAPEWQVWWWVGYIAVVFLQLLTNTLRSVAE